MFSGGWVKLYRCLMEKPIWTNSTPEQKVVLITLLAMANHKGKEWEWKGEKFKCESGQFVTSLDNIVKNCGKGITTQNVRSALKRFEKLDFLTNESTKTGRLVTIVNWGLYQEGEEETNKDNNKEVTKSQQRGNKELTPNKNDKKEKKEKNNIYTDDFEECWTYYRSKVGKMGNKKEGFKKFKESIEIYTVDDIKKAVDKYSKVSKGTEEKYIKTATYFFDSGYIDQYITYEQPKVKKMTRREDF